MTAGEWIALGGLIIAMCGFIITLIVTSKNKTKDDSATGQERGQLLSDLGYVKANTDEIKAEQKSQGQHISEIDIKLARLDEKMQSHINDASIHTRSNTRKKDK